MAIHKENSEFSLASTVFKLFTFRSEKLVKLCAIIQDIVYN